MAIYLELPYPPSVNHYWGQSGNRRFIGKKGVAFRAEVVEAARLANATPIEDRIAVHIELFPPDRRKRDLDNVLKSLLDACEHAGCYVNDSQIDEIHIVRKAIIKNGACNIAIIAL